MRIRITCLYHVIFILATVVSFNLLVPQLASYAEQSDSIIALELVKDNNKPIIEAFLRYELNEVNKDVTQKLLGQYPSLVFFIKQAERGPLKNLLFLEEQVHKLQDAQRNINSLPFSIAFSSAEKKRFWL